MPAFVGLGAPHWDPYARGAILGLTRGTTAAHVARAAVESIAYQVADLLDAMQSDSGTPLPELRVDGGAARNDTLMQFQSDILGIPVVRPEQAETTALGAAYLAGLGVAFWGDLKEIARIPRPERRFVPQMKRSQAESLRQRWNEALSRSKRWEVGESHEPSGDAASRLRPYRALGHDRHRRRRHRRGQWPSMRPRAATTSCLLEQSDFGKGTSSRSTKLVHGGVRYLEQGNISLVMEALQGTRPSAAECAAPGQRPRLRGAATMTGGKRHSMASA